MTTRTEDHAAAATLPVKPAERRRQNNRQGLGAALAFARALPGRLQGALVLTMGLALLLSILEVAGIGAIGLFVTALTAPDALSSNPMANALLGLFGGPEQADLMAVTAVLVTLVLSRNIVNALTDLQRQLFLHGARMHVQTRLLSTYLRQPYRFFLGMHSADMTRNVVQEPNQLVTGVLFSWITLIIDLMMLVMVFAYLMISHPQVTLIATGAIGAIAGLFLLLSRRYVHKLGAHSRALWASMLKKTSEIFAGIKEIKTLGREYAFVGQFTQSASNYSKTTIVHSLLQQLPRYMLEIIIAIALLVAVWLTPDAVSEGGTFISTLAVFAAAAFRLMPIIHRMVSGMLQMGFNQAALEEIVQVLHAPAIVAEGGDQTVPRLPLREAVTLTDVSYAYDDGTVAISDISMTIPLGQSIGVVGRSGAGKTTLIDIVLGLLTPTGGSLAVDGTPIRDDRVRGWRQSLAYVPQNLFLTDDTIRRNIAIGLPDEEVDEDRLWQVVQLAHLQDVIDAMPNGLDTRVGENGLMVSGGQRQRIGLARALYRDADLIVLDEGTSALDGVTEKAVEESLHSLRHDRTVLMVAHRINSLRHCDCIYVMDDGRIAGAGTYAELMETNPLFRSLARAVPGDGDSETPA